MTGEAQAHCEVCDQTGARAALGLCVECLTRWQPDSAYDRAQLAFLFELSPWPRQLGNQAYTIRGEMNERRWSGLYVSYDLVSADNFRAPWQLTYDGGPGWTPIIRMRIWKPNRAGYLIGWCDFRKWQASAMWPEDQHSHAAEWERWEVGWRDGDSSYDPAHDPHSETSFGERLLQRNEQDWLDLRLRRPRQGQRGRPLGSNQLRHLGGYDALLREEEAYTSAHPQALRREINRHLAQYFGVDDDDRQRTIQRWRAQARDWIGA